MLTDHDLVLAAKAIAVCPKNRLPYVLAALEKAGLNIEEDDLPKLRTKEINKTQYLIDSRSEQSREKWKPTDDPYLLKYREAYERGISLTHLGRKVGRQKAAMYQYLYGNTTPNTALWGKIFDAISEEFPDLDPRPKREKPFWEE